MRWKRGVSVILEKSPGNINVQKLRAVFMLEADLNVLHEIIFNGRMTPVFEARCQKPQEIIR